MALLDDVQAAITVAMRQQAAARLSALRMLKAALVNREVERGRALDENESRQVVAALVKQRRDSIEQFTRGGRQDLADKEAAEITVLESYLPAAVDPAVVQRAVADAIAETGAASPKDIGRVMKAVMSKLAGAHVDGKMVNELVRNTLSGSLPPPEVGLARSAGLTAAATLTSRILGLVRDQVLAVLFGAGNEMDAFIVAFRIPNLVRDLFAEGSMSAAFVPTFTRVLTVDGKQAAWRLGNDVMNALLIVTGAVVAIGLVWAQPIVATYAADFASVPGKLELTVRLTRVMLPFLITVAIAAAVMGMLNSLHHYFVPALAPAIFNLATIAGAFTLVPLMPAVGWAPIMAIAIAAVVGGVGQVAMQWPALRREGFRYRPRLDWRDRELRNVLLLMGPGTLGIAATQVNVLLNTLLATSEGTGAVSWLTYAFRLIYLPIGLFGVSIATAVLPAVSRYAAIDDVDGVRDTLSRGVSLMLMLSVPATFGLIVLATPIVQLLFQHGRFLPSDTAPTAAALRLYAVGLIGYSLARIVSPAFYALRQSGTPALVSLFTIGVNIVSSLALERSLGFRGLALGTSLAALVNGALLMLLLRRRLGGIHGGRLAMAFGKILTASLIMAAVVSVVEWGASAVIAGDSVAAQAIRLSVEIGAGLAALAAAARLLAIAEFRDAATLIRERATGQRHPA